jgi:putative phosphoribosyl transferase
MTEQAGTSKAAGELRVFPIEGGVIKLSGILHVPAEAHGLVLLARGIEASEDTAYQRALAQTQLFTDNRLATAVVDLFTTEERALDVQTDFFKQNIEIMQQRLTGLADWLLELPETEKLSIGILGTGAVGAAAIIAAAERPDDIRALVIPDGRLDSLQETLPRIIIPTLLIAAADDTTAVQANQSALNALKVEDKQLEQVQGVSQLFASDDSVKEVLRLAVQWFAQKLVTIPASGSQEL